MAFMGRGARLACAAFAVLWGVAMAGSGLAGHVVIGAHEATHCWVGHVVDRSDATCRVEVYGYGNRSDGYGSACIEPCGPMVVRWWDHPFIYGVVEPLTALGLFLPGIVAAWFAVRRQPPHAAVPAGYVRLGPQVSMNATAEGFYVPTTDRGV